MPWSSSNRRAQLPPDWAARREQVRRRAGGRCENIINGQRCPNAGTDCDHFRSPHDHSLDALQWLCAECHTAKTQREAQAAAAAMRAKLTRPQPRHPGLH